MCVRFLANCNPRLVAFPNQAAGWQQTHHSTGGDIPGPNKPGTAVSGSLKLRRALWDAAVSQYFDFILDEGGER